MKSISEKSQSLPTVFAETNLLFDWVFNRDSDSLYLVELNRLKNINLSLPRFAFAEAKGQSEIIIQRRIQNLQLALSSLRELRRSRHRAENITPLINNLQQVVNQLEQEIAGAKSKIAGIESLCHIIPYNMEIQARAHLRMIERQPPFAENDCIIYESILWFAQQNQGVPLTMLFLTRNRRDFDYPPIHQELDECEIELFFEPGECVKRVRELLALPQET